MKACEVCGTEVLPPFHSFCSHDCVDVVAGRRVQPVVTHTKDGHGLHDEDNPRDKWLSRAGLFAENYGHAETPSTKHLTSSWKEQPGKTWLREGGTQFHAFVRRGAPDGYRMDDGLRESDWRLGHPDGADYEAVTRANVAYLAQEKAFMVEMGYPTYVPRSQAGSLKRHTYRTKKGALKG